MKIRPVIYKLQKQALDYATNELADSGIGGIARFNDLFIEKFAELIIDECCDQIRWVDAYEIREHFGVE
jgi:hypothetical protein